MRQGGGVRRAGRAGAGEEERFSAPRGSTASRPGRHGTAGRAAVPGATPRRPNSPETSAERRLPRLGRPPARRGSAPRPGPFPLSYPGTAASDATPTDAFAPLTCTATEVSSPGPAP